jgi:hypothetical protein
VSIRRRGQHHADTPSAASEMSSIWRQAVVTRPWLHPAGSAACYTGALIGIGFLYHYFAPRASCGLNVAWITLTLIFAVVYTGISVSPWRSPSAGLLTSGVVFIYSTYLVWAALTSEPYGSCSAVSSTKALQVLLAQMPILSQVARLLGCLPWVSEVCGTRLFLYKDPSLPMPNTTKLTAGFLKTVMSILSVGFAMMSHCRVV